MNSSAPDESTLKRPEGRAPGVSFGLVLLVLGIAAVLLARRIPSGTLGDTHDPGPRAFPTWLGFVLALGGAAELLRAWRGSLQSGSRRREETLTSGQSESRDLDCYGKSKPPPAWQILAAIIAYVALMPYAGFAVATVLFAGWTMWRLGTRAWLALGIALALVALVWLLFVRLFKVQLPAGPLPW